MEAILSPLTESSRKRWFSVSINSTGGQQQQQQATYQVIKVSGYGTVQESILSVTDLLENYCDFHVRDLFALKLTTDQKSRRSQNNAYVRYTNRPRPVILPRGNEIIIAFGNVRAVIGKEAAMLFDAHDPNIKFLAKELVELFQTRLFSYQDPFELVFIEEILRDACNTFDLRLKVLEPIVESSLSEISVIDTMEVHHLIPLKDTLQELEIEVKQSLKCLTDFLNDDQELLSLLLTETAAANQRGVPLDISRHVKVELLFEEYARQLDNILHEIYYLLKRIESNTQMVALSMDSFRNRWLRVNVYFSIIGISLATSTTVAGFFGMNLVHGYEEHPDMFYYVTALTGVSGFILFLGCTSYVRGAIMKFAALRRVEEIKTINRALEDMRMLEYVAKTTLKNKDTLTMESFQEKLSEYTSSPVSGNEADLLFKALDNTKNGVLSFDDFQPFKYAMAPLKKKKKKTEKMSQKKSDSA